MTEDEIGAAWVRARSGEWAAAQRAQDQGEAGWVSLELPTGAGTVVMACSPEIAALLLSVAPEDDYWPDAYTWTAQ